MCLQTTLSYAMFNKFTWFRTLSNIYHGYFVKTINGEKLILAQKLHHE